MEPLNFGDKCFVHCLGRNVWTIIQAGGEQFVHCREVVHSSACPLSEVPLYTIQCLKLKVMHDMFTHRVNTRS